MLQVAPVFSDNMVLQRDRDVPVWGAGGESSVVRVSFGAAKAEAAVKNGVWQCELPPQKAGAAGNLTISDGETSVSFKNVIFGDVWLAGGQSNMELELKNCLNGEAELAACANPNIRVYQAIKQAFVDDSLLQAERGNGWKVCAPDAAANMSAAAYFFARKIAADTGVPIGIIGCSWGGTSISCWMSEGQLARSAAGRKYLDNYAALVGGKTDAEYDAQMEAYFADWRAWDARVQARRVKDPSVTWEVLNKECGECPWPQPAGRKSPYRPTNLYHSMIRRVAPFALKGFLYYQGEEDDLRAADYGEMMCYLIDQWRTDWRDDGLFFLFVQLPMWASRSEFDEGLVSKNWPVIRENQYKVSKIIANTGMAVAIDRGEFDNIHPLDKQTIGFRLALQALKKVYGKNVEADGPVFRKAKNEGTRIRVYFDNVAPGLVAREVPDGSRPLTDGTETADIAGFEVAGADGVYRAARAVIDGGTVIALSPDVPRPERVRYAWIKWGPTPLYAKNGLPAMPFRSDRLSNP